MVPTPDTGESRSADGISIPDAGFIARTTVTEALRLGFVVRMLGFPARRYPLEDCRRPTQARRLRLETRRPRTEARSLLLNSPRSTLSIRTTRFHTRRTLFAEKLRGRVTGGRFLGPCRHALSFNNLRPCVGGLGVLPDSTTVCSRSGVRRHEAKALRSNRVSSNGGCGSARLRLAVQ